MIRLPSARRLSFTVLLLGAPCLAARVQGGSAVADIRRAEEQMHDAYVHHKTDLFGSLYADDATFIYNSGSLVDKATRVAGFDKAAAFVGEQDVVQRIRLYGDVAIVSCLTSYPNAAKTEVTALQITRVWHRTSGGWTVVSFQSTKTKVPEGASVTQPDKITFEGKA